MGVDPDFYEFTRGAAGPDDIHWLTVDEMLRYGLITKIRGASLNLAQFQRSVHFSGWGARRKTMKIIKIIAAAGVSCALLAGPAFRAKLCHRSRSDYAKDKAATEAKDAAKDMASDAAKEMVDIPRHRYD